MCSSFRAGTNTAAPAGEWSPIRLPTLDDDSSLP